MAVFRKQQEVTKKEVHPKYMSSNLMKACRNKTKLGNKN
jgi:hypothetical protein